MKPRRLVVNTCLVLVLFFTTGVSSPGPPPPPIVRHFRSLGDMAANLDGTHSMAPFHQVNAVAIKKRRKFDPI